MVSKCHTSRAQNVRSFRSFFPPSQIQSAQEDMLYSHTDFDFCMSENMLPFRSKPKLLFTNNNKSTTCHLLRIPAELRLQIFDNLTEDAMLTPMDFRMLFGGEQQVRGSSLKCKLCKNCNLTFPRHHPMLHTNSSQRSPLHGEYLDSLRRKAGLSYSLRPGESGGEHLTILRGMLPANAPKITRL